MEERTFSIRRAVEFGWKITIKNIWFLVGLLIALWIISAIAQFLVRAASGQALLASVFIIMSWAINAILTMGAISIALRLYNNEKPEVKDIYSSYPLLLNYAAGLILFWLISIAGLLFLVVPGVIFILRLQYFSFFIVDKKEGPVEALKSSWLATKGNAFKLFGMWFVLLGVMILGALALFVGLFVAIPVVILAMTFVYKSLSGSQLREDEPKTI